MKDAISPSNYAAMDRTVRKALSKAIKGCSKSREAIAEELSIAIGMPLKVRSLDNYTAESRTDYRFPVAWIVPFCDITGDHSLGRLLLSPDDQKSLQVGQREIEQHRAIAETVEQSRPTEPRT
jgi:hypothetical protein